MKKKMDKKLNVNMDNLHSEYRSTYRWHEYRGARAAAQGAAPPAAAAPAVGAAPAPLTNGVEEPVVRRAPLPSQVNANGPRAPSIEPAMPRRKKYPGLAYKTNEIFDGPAAGLPSGGRDGGPYTLDRARSMERTKYLASSRDRRSKSEGPRNAQNGPRNWTDTVEEKATSPSIEPTRASSEYRNQYAWPRGGDTGAGAGAGGYMDGAGGQPRKSASMGALKAAQQARRRPAEGAPPELEPLMNHTDDDDDRKKYIEDFLREGETNTNQRKTTFRSAIATIRRGVGGDQPREPAKPAKGYKSEYKKKFRPFSHYVYEASKGTFTKRRAPKPGVAEAEGADGAAPPASQEPGNALQAAGLQSLGMKNADSWYREVLDLRKRAGEYKYRGWGTELAPDHLTELYNKQMELWYQVSRRSSLSALSLASTNHRVLGKDDKDMDIKSRTSPSKKLKSFKSFPYQSIHAKIQETKQQQETPAQRAQRRKLQGHSFDNTSVSEGARGASVEPSTGDHAKPLYRSPKRRPRSADPKPLSNGPLEDKRRPSKPSDDDAIPLRSGSAFRDHRGTLLDDSPVVKSPPEPTRVKSPEQMNMRSPDPVNWTVPLDTGKTFTVTQNVKSDDLIKRPGSDFRGGWGGDDTHSASFSAPLEPIEALNKAHQEVASVHRSPTANHSTKDVTPPKSVEISQKPCVTIFKHAKTPTSPPNLTPIDEMKVLDVTKPIVNGGGSSGSDAHPSPVTEGRLPPPQIILDDPSFEMAALIKSAKSAKSGDNFKPTEATQKSYGVDTSVVTPSSQASIAAEVLEKARTRFDQFWGKKDGTNDSV